MAFNSASSPRTHAVLLCTISATVSANGRQLANYIPSIVHSEYTRDPSNKHTSKSDPGWMLKLNDSEPFAVKISANLSKKMRDGCSRQKIVPPSRLPNGFVVRQQVENLHRAEQINAGLQAAQSAVNQTSVATTDELKETAEAKNVAFNALSKSVTQNSEHNIQCKNVVVNILEDMHRLHDRVTSLVAALPTAQKQVEAASQEGEVFGDDNSSCATENVRDATRSGDDLHGNPS